ncbi:hypothetical protein NIES4103_18100 [Nostoc sp. NIES-4103]|nr:hypothetical protein NIES4103_18100 [Nostoc sp. NIES-4103]
MKFSTSLSKNSIFQISLISFASFCGLAIIPSSVNSTILVDGETTTAITQQIEQIQSVQELQAKLIAVTKERDRLLQALKTEQENHAQTHKSLTTALGDAIDSLARQRAGTEAHKGKKSVS